MVKMAGICKNRGPNASDPATPEMQPVTIASRRVFGLTNSSAYFLNSP
jgi:hypothetical protein